MLVQTFATVCSCIPPFLTCCLFEPNCAHIFSEGAEGRGEGASHAEDALVTTAASWCCERIECEMLEDWIPLVVDSHHRNGSTCLGTRSALELVAFIEVVRVLYRLNSLMCSLAALACEYLVRVAAFVVGKLHYDRLGRCDPLWVLLLKLINPAHLI